MGEFPVLASIPLPQLDLGGADAKMSGARLTMELPRNQHREYWDMTEGCHSGRHPRRKRIKKSCKMLFGVWLSNVDGNVRGILCSGHSYLAEAVSDEFSWS